MPHKDGGYLHHVWYFSGRGVEVMENEPPVRTPEEGHLNQRKARKVCAACNSGWMSKIVEAAKPIAKSLILGEPATLTADDQRVLASWITLTCIMAEYATPLGVGVTPAERVELMLTGMTPFNWTICIGRYRGVNWTPVRYMHLVTTVNDGASQPKPPTIDDDGVDFNTLQVSTYTLGELAIHAMSTTAKSYFSKYRRRFLPVEMPHIAPIGTDPLNHRLSLSWTTIDWRSSPDSSMRIGIQISNAALTRRSRSVTFHN